MNCTCEKHKHFDLCKSFRARGPDLMLSAQPTGPAETTAKQNQVLKDTPA